jgi:CXXX repeat peptide maturase
MIQYLVILLDDTSVSFCHYQNDKKERNLMPFETLKAGIVYAMKENLNIQFVYPSYPLSEEYLEVIDSIDHTDIKLANLGDDADVVVMDGINQIPGANDNDFKQGVSYVLRLSKHELFEEIANVCALLNKVERLNVVITDVENFTDADFERYSEVLRMLSEEVEKLYVAGKVVQLNLLTDRMMLDKMNNCGAGDTSVTLAPDGKFYVCPAFYLTDEDDGMGALHTSIGDVKHGLDIKNPQLYKLDHAPLCRRCDAYQCKRCIWLNRKMTFEVNTPSHEQCVMAHLERNASRDLLNAIRKYGAFLPEQEEIKEITYLDPFDVRKEW